MPADGAWRRLPLRRKAGRAGLALIALVALALAWLAVIWRVPPGQPSAPPPGAAPAAALRLAAAGRPGADSELPQPRETAQPPAAPAAPVTPPPPVAASSEPEPEPQVIGHPMELERLQPPPAEGPSTLLARRFAGESQPAGARSRESQISALFDDPNVDQELLDSVLCRRSVCRLVLQWTPLRAIGTLVALAHLRRTFGADQLAVGPAASPTADGARRIEVWVGLAPDR